ncbi:unnamed protein product [Caenorhabditis auriculariae]|uniref:Saposin B-type domain-containing protein n=1 Tax=Caenorhabditis auriculariae TaxID=2777116 RepID=A0A8S1HK23_9PELO|nr:unnamed protein product [Caenorhabditis auriculariae]
MSSDFVIFLLAAFGCTFAQPEVEPPKVNPPAADPTGHRFCAPCKIVANTLKTINKISLFQQVEKQSCNMVLHSDATCGGAVSIVSMYIDRTPADVMCERLLLCPFSLSTFTGIKFFAPADQETIGSLEAAVIKILNENLGADNQTRFARNALFGAGSGDSASLSKTSEAIETFADNFSKALALYLKSPHK